MKWYWYFFRTENRNWTEFYHLKNIKYQQIFRFLLSGILVPVIQSNGTENFDRSAKSGKKVILRKVSPFFHRDASRSIWSLPGITGFSVQMVSALLVLPHKKVWEVVVNSVLDKTDLSKLSLVKWFKSVKYYALTQIVSSESNTRV